MTKPKLFVPDSEFYAKPFTDMFDVVMHDIERIRECDVIMFTGGADINPEIYGEPRGMYTDPPSMRDRRELEVYAKALKYNKKFLGICRGAQLLCALAGGKLAQHIENHSLGYEHKHRVMTATGAEMDMNSIHHQMMLPWGTKHDLLAWCENRSSVHLDGKNDNIDVEVEPEVVYFHDNQALGIQCHPEAGYAKTHPAMLFFKELIRERLL